MTRFYQTSSNGFLDLVLDIESQSVDIASNTSVVSYSLIIRKNRAYWGYSINDGMSYDVSFDAGSGREYVVNTYGNYDLRNQSEQVLTSGTFTVSHDHDGSKQIWVEANIYNIRNVGNITGVNGYATLPTIPRFSTASVSDGVIGSSVAISISSAVSSFRHKLSVSWHNKNKVIAEDVASSFNYYLPMDFCEDVTSSDRSWGTIFVDTYNGSTWIGQSSATFNASVPASVKPSLSGVDLRDKNSKVANLLRPKVYAQILSDVSVNFRGAFGAYGSTISSYHAEIIGKGNSISSNGASLGLMNFSGDYVVSAWVIDSRGRSSDKVNVPIKVLEYFSPTIMFDVKRGGSDGQTAVVTRSINAAPLRLDGWANNRIITRYSALEVSSNSRVDLGGENRSDVFVFDKDPLVLSGKILATKSYIITGTISDYFSSSSFQVTIGPDKVLMSYAPTGIGIGKIHQSGSLDVAGVANFEEIRLNGERLSIPKQSLSIMDLQVRWYNVTFSNGWHDYDNNHKVQVSRSVDGTVVLRGSISGGDTTWDSVILTLPRHCRPTQRAYFPVIMSNNYNTAFVVIEKTGDVKVRNNLTDNNWVCLDGISFRL